MATQVDEEKRLSGSNSSDIVFKKDVENSRMSNPLARSNEIVTNLEFNRRKELMH